MAKSKPPKQNPPKPSEPKRDSGTVAAGQAPEAGGLPEIDFKKLLGCG